MTLFCLVSEIDTFFNKFEKLKTLQSQVRIGGKGTPRRIKKVVHSTQATDDKKLQSSLKKLSVNTIPGIEEVNMIKEDGSRLASTYIGKISPEDEEDVPDLVETLDEASKAEVAKNKMADEKPKEN
ncbi:hypothetical protein WA026_014340 [Henosepilachna vigintioctopunctata]|uniref:Transcription factor BTF3 n=1 Tax=Henosepilachna vigintioctopunctata TaxID=420089 RepID=A0AAW1ULT0_9CUCU